MLALVAVRLYDPLLTRVVNVPATFPLVDIAVVFMQYVQPTNMSPLTVITLTEVELAPSSRTPPFTFDIWTELNWIVDGTNAVMFAV